MVHGIDFDCIAFEDCDLIASWREREIKFTAMLFAK
jgi:hypothetical protein